MMIIYEVGKWHTEENQEDHILKERKQYNKKNMNYNHHQLFWKKFKKDKIYLVENWKS